MEQDVQEVPETAVKTVAAAKTTGPIVTLPKEIAGLLEKSTTVKNYQYLFQQQVRQANGNYQQTSYQVYLKEGKAKKAYLAPKEYANKQFYTEVYLDVPERKAYGVCSDETIACEDIDQKAFPLSFAEEKITTPFDIIDQIPPTTKKFGTEKVEARDAMVIEYRNGETITRVSLDTYQGVPLKYQVLKESDDQEVLQKEILFSEFAANNVLNGDVTLPERYAVR